MKHAIAIGIGYLKREGIGSFTKRFAAWIPQYFISIYCKGIGSLRKRLDWFDTFFVIHEKKKHHICCHQKYKNISGGIEYCQNNLLEYNILHGGEIVEVLSANYFEGTEGCISVYECPPIYVSVFHDAMVYSASDLLTVKDTAVSDMFIRDNERGRYDVRGGRIVKCKAGEWLLTAYNECEKTVDKAILLLGWAANNYYHFSIEILSKLAFVDADRRYIDYPLLVDECVSKIPQMAALLDYVNINHHPVIWVDDLVRIKVKEVVYISRTIWMPPLFFESAVPEPGDYLFSRYCVSNIRDRVLSQVEEKNISKFKKIYLSRKNCENQRLVNTDKIEQLFRNSGYCILYPENMTFEEEVEAFHNADIIVGPTGAAFTNIIYCKEGCSVNIIAPDQCELYFFSNLANIVHVSFTILGARIIKKGIAASADIFELDERKAMRFIQSMEK